MRDILLFNKPFNVLSQFTDKQDRSTLKDHINQTDLRVAGRLDRDSEGLLVLTNSGPLVHKITHPAKHMSKTYWVQVEGSPTAIDLAPLEDGIELNDGRCLPATGRLMGAPTDLWPRDPPIRVRKSITDQWLTVTLSEGRNRQVRRMCASLGFPVLRLIRYRVGSWTLDGLATGESRHIALS
jgi:23S rRNA pseudouridine2457 synthase